MSGGGEFGFHRVAGGLQGVDAEVDGRAGCDQGVGFGDPGFAEGAFEFGDQPFGDAGLHPGGFSRVGVQAFAFVVGERRGGVAVAGEQQFDFVDGVFFGERTQHQGAAVVVLQAPGVTRPAAQARVHAFGDGAAVAAAGEAVRPAPGFQHRVRRRARVRDEVEDLGGGGKAGLRRQEVPLGMNRAATTMSRPTIEMNQTRVRTLGTPAAYSGA